MNTKFNKVWNELSEKGVCDSIYGMEYYRVLDEFLKSDCKQIAAFIKKRANKF